MCIDRHELVKAKKKLLSQLLKIPDDEKTTSDIELEAELMNDWEIEGFFLSDREKRKLAEIDKARGDERGQD